MDLVKLFMHSLHSNNTQASIKGARHISTWNHNRRLYGRIVINQLYLLYGLYYLR